MNTEILRVTDKCNQKCLFCNFSEKLPFLSLVNLKCKIDKLIESGVEEIIFSGGEPTIYPHILSGIQYAKKKGIKHIEIQSNGLFLANLLRVKKYKEIGLDLAFLSILSHKPAIHDYLTQIPGSFSKIIQAVKNLLSVKIRTRINIVINKKNYQHLLSLTQFIHLNFKDIESIDFSFIVSQGQALKNSFLVPKISKVTPHLLMAYKYCEENNIKFSNPGCGIPVCFIPQYKNISLEYQELNNKSNSQMINKNINNKVKIGKCISCKEAQFCLGIWKNYLLIHGNKEFI